MWAEQGSKKRGSTARLKTEVERPVVRVTLDSEHFRWELLPGVQVECLGCRSIHRYSEVKVQKTVNTGSKAGAWRPHTEEGRGKCWELDKAFKEERQVGTAALTLRALQG